MKGAAFGKEHVQRYDRRQVVMTDRSTATTIDEYMAEFPPATRAVLREVRGIIAKAAPGATETISYAIPTFDLGGKHLIHFAGYAGHVGVYPGASGIAAFRDELTAYKSGKGSVRFPLSEPMPADLIRRMVEFRIAEVGAQTRRRRA
jgi:uncharacterized protein YdhG (YjbR/CyaY superfamily)